MQPTLLRTRLQLELLKKLREKKSSKQKGFTLVELMIVVAVVGILSAVALPSFLGARRAAAAGAAIGEVLGLAKECATFKAAEGIGVAPTIGGTACTSNTAQTFTASWTGTVDGVRCLTATASADTSASITVSSTGTIGCTM